jgi:hypothetical protein
MNQDRIGMEDSNHTTCKTSKSSQIKDNLISLDWTGIY